MSMLDKLKRDLTRHRHKAVVLVVLFVVMLVLTVRAVLQLQPRPAKAALIADAAAPLDSLQEDGGGTPAGDAEDRIRQSKALWHTLREVRGTAAGMAFSFDASFYPPDPTQRASIAAPERVEVTPATPIPDQTEALHRAQVAAIRDQSHALVVKSTTMSGSGKPWAIVNQQLVSVGQEVLGFEITAIRSREVEFVKDGVTIVVKMSDDIRGQ